MLDALIAIPVSYGIGSIPVAYLAGRWAGGIDIREHGSGNVGASNVWQTVSKGLVVPVLRDAERLSFAQVELAIADFFRVTLVAHVDPNLWVLPRFATPLRSVR